MADDMRPAAEALLRDRLRAREGYELKVKRDTKGFLFAGIGHTLLAQHDGDLRLGDTITPQLAERWFNDDVAPAMVAAAHLMAETPVASAEWWAALAVVCFQLGGGWTAKFPETWAEIREGMFERAADMLDNTDWQKETPVRVADFQASLRACAPWQTATALAHG